MFTLSFPEISTSVATPAPPPRPRSALTPADRRYHVLVVEDQVGVRHLVSRVLTRHGYVVIEANGATEARSAFTTHGDTIDLLITDVVMPDTRGPELASELCALRPSLRVLLMSGYAGEDLESRLDLAFNFVVLEKPFAASDLLQATREVLATAAPSITQPVTR